MRTNRLRRLRNRDVNFRESSQIPSDRSHWNLQLLHDETTYSPPDTSKGEPDLFSLRSPSIPKLVDNATWTSRTRKNPAVSRDGTETVRPTGCTLILRNHRAFPGESKSLIFVAGRRFLQARSSRPGPGLCAVVRAPRILDREAYGLILRCIPRTWRTGARPTFPAILGSPLPSPHCDSARA